MKVLIFGATGQLGKDIQRVLKKDFTLAPVTHDQCDITKDAATQKFINESKPDWVINCAAWTDVPGCELDDQKAFTVNALGAKHVAAGCAKAKSKLIHISTDYVFDGNENQPYSETSLCRPVNVYGLSKLAGEHYIQMTHDQYFIIRTSGLYGIHPNRGKKTNFVETMLKLAKERDVVKVVDDEILTPTFTLNLAQQIKILMGIDRYGIYHATNNGSCSWYEFTRKIFEIAKINTRLEKTTVKEFASPVKRPAYSVLKNLNLQNLGIDFMKMWDAALEDYFLDKENKLKL
ncbi:dTDP-4-dehydrorhamnose reductase [bacterium]|nr:dTDP-4-dehydrorhamnose reductase [bacterium]